MATARLSFSLSALAILAAVTALYVSLSDRVTPSAPSAVSVIDLVRQHKVIRAGYVVYPPSVMKAPGSEKPGGVFVDTLESIASDIRVKVEWVEVTWATFVAGLQADQYDVAVGAFYENPQRAMDVAYSIPLYYLGSAVIVRADDNRFHTVEDLNHKGVRITVPQGSGEHEFSQSHLKNATIVALPGTDLNLPLAEVSSGRADASISDAPTIRAYAAAHPSVKALFLDAPINLTAVAWAVRPDDMRWLAFLNSSIRFMTTSGKIQKIEKQYGADFLRPQIIWARPNTDTINK